jgi:hypothetical protein
MKTLKLRGILVLLTGLAGAALPAAAQSIPLVNKGDPWHYRGGTNEPQADWRSATDAMLDGTWLTGPGGFGYGDPGILGEATTLTGMGGVHSTLYIRRTFEVTNAIDTNWLLQLVVDYDDGFIAYLDGVALTNANTTNASLTVFPFNATTGGNSHEASCCNSPNPATTFNLGAVGNRLAPGPHVLALHGMNQTAGSSDFHLIADLLAVTNSGGSGIPGALVSDTTWTPAMSPIVLTTNVIVPTNVTLTLQAGTVVKLGNGLSIRAIAGGTINVEGTAANKVMVMPNTGVTHWRELSAMFPGSRLNVRHLDMGGGQVSVYSNAVGVVEDSYFHDYRPGGGIFAAPIMITHFAGPTIFRRCHFREYHETLFRNGISVAEDCLFENIHGDGLDFDGALSGSALRRCTFRHGVSGNVDAIDVGNDGSRASVNVLIEDCLMYDFPFDKGVSVGDNNLSTNTVVRNCLIYGCLSGVMAKDNCDVSVQQCTLVNNNWGFTNYNKANPGSPTGGGITTNTFNNILWNNGITISMVNNSQLYADHNDFGGTNWPGAGNIDVDPLFVNAAQRDYRLATNSPCRGAGRNGADLGARFPVGAPMALSHPRIESLRLAGGNAVIDFWADNERSYSLLCSDAVDGTWTSITNVPTGTVPVFASVTNALQPGARFYRLVSPMQMP